MADALTRLPDTGSSRTDDVPRPILLADASPRSARIAEHLLRTTGYSVVVCADGETAFRKASTLGPAALVLDPALRGMQGLAFLPRLKRQPDPVPVVLTSRDESVLEDVAVTSYPRIVVVPKPYGRRELIAAVRRCIEKRRSGVAAIGPDAGSVRAMVQGPTLGVFRTPVLEVGVCARGSFGDTFFRVLPIGGQRTGLFVAEREAGPADTVPIFRRLGRALDEAVDRGASPAGVVERADRTLQEGADGTLMAALALEMDLRTKDLVLCRAGFHAPLAAAPGGSPAEIHLPFGALLGAVPGGGAAPAPRTVRIPFPEDGALLVRSAGALLTVGQGIPELGHRLFLGYLREHAGSALPVALEALLGVLGALGVQGPGRDLLLMVVRRRKSGRPAP